MKDLKDIKSDTTTRMGKAVDALRHELQKLRTGRASTALIEHLRVDYYGSNVPISQVAQVSVIDARTLGIQPWEKQMVQPIEKAIMQSELGLNPATAGTMIRIPLPPLTEQRRKDLSKHVAHEGENAKVAVRNIRRDANHHGKELLKAKQITEDDERRFEDEIQKLTDRHISDIDEVVKGKEKELMEI